MTKLIPLLHNFSSKQPLEVLVVDLKVEHLCSLAAEVNVCCTLKNRFVLYPQVNNEHLDRFTLVLMGCRPFVGKEIVSSGSSSELLS